MKMSMADNVGVRVTHGVGATKPKWVFLVPLHSDMHKHDTYKSNPVKWEHKKSSSQKSRPIHLIEYRYHQFGVIACGMISE